LKAYLKVKCRKVKCGRVKSPSIKDNEVLIRVQAAGICGSDIFRVTRNDAKENIILGHEIAGIVEDKAEGVKSVKIGQRVVVIPLIPCFKCYWCTRGQFSFCPNYDFIGSRRNGGLAQYVNVPVRNVFMLPDSLDFETGVMIEPLSVVLHTFERISFETGSTLAILGAGTLGLLALQVAKLRGAQRVFISDVKDEKLKLAKLLGADICLNPSKQKVEDTIKKLTSNIGVDFVIESSGNNQAKLTAIRISRCGGSIFLVGSTQQNLLFPASLLDSVTRRELLLRGIWMSYASPFPGSAWIEARDLLNMKKIKVKPLITHRFKIDDIDQAFNMILNNKDNFCKVIIKPW